MIDKETRQAVCLLHKKGVSISQIKRQLHISRNTVKTILTQNGKVPVSCRSDRIDLDAELLRDLHRKCLGWKERMHEVLLENGIKIGYSSLTRRVRELGFDRINTRCGRVEDEIGKEMQHDTSTYKPLLSGKKTRLIASMLYFRYSKQRYLKFYPAFDRFRMKCFFYEALNHFGYAADECIIDNTNLAVDHGTGKNAVMNSGMAKFLDMFGSKFVAHEIGHSNRKAGEERSFWTVSTNFFPGREFSDLEDLNRQALEWSTVTMAARPQTKKDIIPNLAFEEEKPYLHQISPHLPRPYQVHNRDLDQYGYVAFGGNYFWVPGTTRHPVEVLEYAESIKVLYKHEELIEHQLPPHGTKQKVITPPGMPEPERFPKNQKRPSGEEEKELRAIGEEVSDYLDFILQQKGLKRHIFVRDLHRLSRRGSGEAFKKTLMRAHKYQVKDIGTIERIFIFHLNADKLEPLSYPHVDEEYTKRVSFEEGEFSSKPDFSQYDELLNEETD